MVKPATRVRSILDRGSTIELSDLKLFLQKHKTLLLTICVVCVIKLLLIGWAYINYNFAANPSSTWLNLWDRWDSAVYKAIATSSYNQTAGTQPDWWPFLSHFPPLYPLLIHTVSRLGISVVGSGILVAFVAILLASVLLYKLVILEFRNETSAVLAVLFLNLFPTSYFTVAIYSESLFLLCTIASFYCLRREKFVLAGLFAGCAVLTRNIGIVLVPVYLAHCVYHYVQNRRIDLKRLSLVSTPIIAEAVYMGINKIYYGEYFFFITEKESFWKTKHLIVPLKESYNDFVLIFQHTNVSNEVFMTTRGWNAVFVAFALVITILGVKRVKWDYTLYSVLSILTFASLSWGISNARYVFGMFPIFIVLSSIENRWVQGGILGVSAVMLLYFSKVFTGGAWAF